MEYLLPVVLEYQLPWVSIILVSDNLGGVLRSTGYVTMACDVWTFKLATLIREKLERLNCAGKVNPVYVMATTLWGWRGDRMRVAMVTYCLRYIKMGQ